MHRKPLSALVFIVYIFHIPVTLFIIQAFKFPDSMEVHFQCTIQICRYQCPDQCSEPLEAGYGPPLPPLPLEAYLQAAGVGVGAARPRDERRVRRQRREVAPPEKSVGVNRVIRVVSTGDLIFPLDDPQPGVAAGSEASSLICMTTPGFAATLVVLLAVLLASCLVSALLCVRLRPQRQPKKARSCFYS